MKTKTPKPMTIKETQKHYETLERHLPRAPLTKAEASATAAKKVKVYRRPKAGVLGGEITEVAPVEEKPTGPCPHCGTNISELEEFRKWKREQEWRAARGLT